MFANSRSVRSRQTGPHADLAEVVRRHLRHPFQKPLLDYNRAAAEAALAAWRAWNPAAPLMLDSGCGVGWSSVQLARQWPHAFVLGVDQSAHRLGRDKAALGEMPANMALIRADLVDFWRLLAAAGVKLARHYLLYPNPWPKIGHLRRRWHGHPVFPALLALGGVLECRSNWDIYVQELAWALELATGRPAGVQRWEPQGRYLTPFERKYRESGQTLWRLEFDLGATE
ncbi:MAG: SAM-dependent methyltransferase [Azovibrio sp.]|nr:SAM-dependent methyltransferase [Azovibrio sp.]